MIIKYFMIFKLLIQIQSYIQFDQGYNQYFGNGIGSTCADTNTIETIVKFSGTFEIPPQILITPGLLSIPSNPSNSFTVDILFITNKQFQIKISCALSIGHYQFYWYAVNDKRISILQYLHTFDNLLQASQAIVILHSWGMNQSPLNFYLEVYEVASTTVKIKLHNSNSNLINIGYQIVLGTSQAFLKSQIIESPGGRYTLLTKTLTKLNYGTLFIPLVGFDWRVLNPIRIILTSKQILDNFEYTISTFDGTAMNAIRVYELWLFQQILFPMYIYSYRVAKKYERFIAHPIKVSILELDSEYYNIGDFQAQVPDMMTTLTIQIELKFYKGEKLIGSMLKCNECGQKNVYKIEQNYLGGYNFIKYRLLLRQYSIDVQNLKISINLSSITINQMFNQVVQEYQIVNLQFVWAFKRNVKNIAQDP